MVESTPFYDLEPNIQVVAFMAFMAFIALMAFIAFMACIGLHGLSQNISSPPPNRVKQNKFPKAQAWSLPGQGSAPAQDKRKEHSNG